MNAEIISVGTELLMGQILNTNTRYLSGRMADFGINMYYHVTVGDNPARLKQCIANAFSLGYSAVYRWTRAYRG